MKEKETTLGAITLSDLKSLIPPQPSATVLLPSKGLFYDREIVKDGRVEIMPMNARSEKLLAGMRGNNVDDVIDSLLRRSLVTKIDPDDLLVTDRFYLLLMLRANSYGESYTFELGCPHCDVVGKYEVKIPGDFEINYSDDNDIEPFEVTLPVTKLVMKYRLLRGKDAKAIRQHAEKETKKGFIAEGDPGYLFNMAKHVVTVNNRSIDLFTAMELLGQLPAMDSATFKNAYDKKTPGILTVIKKSCISCGKGISTELPVSAEFFRPNDTTKA